MLVHQAKLNGEFRLPGPVQVSDSVPEPKTLSR
jgi:hypothetical protein